MAPGAEPMSANPVQGSSIATRPSPLLGLALCCFLFLFLLPAAPSAAQHQADSSDPTAHLPTEIRDRFLPKPIALPNEHLVFQARLLNALPVPSSVKAYARQIWRANGGAILDPKQGQLTLHFYVQAIKPLTLADRLWEGLPQRADSMQQLIDHAITRARTTSQPIDHLIIAGHAGLPGCCAFGGTLDDCVFEGRLTTYQTQQLARLKPYLARDAQIELRQCRTGSGKQGQQLLTRIYQTTGATTTSYLADFHFGDSNAHPRIRVGANGVTFLKPKQ